jgi:hypothetical protein
MISSNVRTLSRLLFLVAAMSVTSAYKFRCYWFCTDQTSTQNDYIEQRDRCRDYAQLKLDMEMKSNNLTDDDKTRKATLVSLFSQCMGQNGWTVPDGKTDKDKDKDKAAAAPAAVAGAAIAGAAAAPPAPTPAQIAEEKAQAKSALSRTSECDFARYDAAVSSIAASRAKACDLECAQRLRAAPEAPRPAACPSDRNPLLLNGHERE